MKLSILICSIPERRDKRQRLIDQLKTQIFDDVDVYYIESDPISKGGSSIGTKRNILLGISNADYVAFIDDDDSISYDYIEQLLKGIELGVDAVTFNGQMLSNGTNELFELKLGNKYTNRLDGVIKYKRPPNHLCAIKRTIMLAHPFEEKSFAEDLNQCLEMQNSGAITTEYHIEKVLYYYNYINKKKYVDYHLN